LAIAPPPKYAVDDLPPDILAGIGKIIAWWGYLQFQLGAILREATAISENAGYVLTVGPDLSDLCRAIRSVADSDLWIADLALRKDLRKLVGDVLGKAGVRNSYAHGVFGPGKTN
jgi:hypothetical protein